jgi:hypothetical protein
MEEEKIDQDPRIEERESFFQIKRDLKGAEEEEEEGWREKKREEESGQGEISLAI